MMADNGISPAFAKGGAVDHIGHGPVMADKIKIHRGKIIQSVAQVPDQGDGL